MIRRKDEQTVERKCIRNGVGETEMRRLLNGAEEMLGKGRMFNHMTLAPGNTIGEHTHTGDNEFFYFLSGAAEYNDNGTWVRRRASGIHRFDPLQLKDPPSGSDEPEGGFYIFSFPHSREKSVKAATRGEALSLRQAATTSLMMGSRIGTSRTLDRVRE